MKCTFKPCLESLEARLAMDAALEHSQDLVVAKVHLDDHTSEQIMIGVDSGLVADVRTTNAGLGKCLTVRPRPSDHSTLPAPVDSYGDVGNIDNAPGGNDSVWMDLDSPK